jgi:amidase
MTIGSLQTIVSSTWKRLSQPSWIELAQSARTQRDETLSKVNPPLPPFPDPLPLNSQDLPKQMLSAREYELTQNYDAVELLETLRAKRVSSEELTCAFLRRAVVAQYAVSWI